MTTYTALIANIANIATLKNRAGAISTTNQESFITRVKSLSESISALSQQLAGNLDALVRQPGFDQIHKAMDDDEIFGVRKACDQLRTVRGQSSE